jgi:hypothetical protein
MPETLAPAFQGWQNFYLLVGTAAATLVGLMFVAISLGSRLITQKDIPALRVYVSPTVVHFIYVLVIAAVAMIPSVTRVFLGILLLGVGLISCGRTAGGLPLIWRPQRERFVDTQDVVWYLLVPSVSYLLLVGAGVGLLLGAGQALNGLALASILLLTAGLRNAWDLVVWMVLRQNEPPARESSTESRAEPVVKSPAQPAKQPADKPTSLALSPAHQAEVGRVIEDAGLNPRDFTWALQPSRHALFGPLISALVHTRTGRFFRFEFIENASGQTRVSVFSPGDGAPEMEKAAGSWEDQLEHIRQWLKSLRQPRG